MLLSAGATPRCLDFSCVSTGWVPAAPATGAVLPCLCLVPAWRRGCCAVRGARGGPVRCMHSTLGIALWGTCNAVDLRWWASISVMCVCLWCFLLWFDCLCMPNIHVCSKLLRAFVTKRSDGYACISKQEAKGQCIVVVLTSWQGLQAVRCHQELRSPMRTDVEFLFVTLVPALGAVGYFIGPGITFCFVFLCCTCS